MGLQKIADYLRAFSGGVNESARAEVRAPPQDWHPHFGLMAGTSLDVWLSRFPTGALPQQSLVLATDERTGSELLCQMLGATGRLGRPSEYLNTAWNQRFIPDYPNDVKSQIVIAHRAGTTLNGCFSMKLHPWHVDRLLLESTMAATFPAPKFVRLTRQDLLSQAISLYRARQTGRFHSHIDEQSPAEFDAHAIAVNIQHLAANRARWDMYFARNEISPLNINYEELCTDPFNVVQSIGDLMGEPIKKAQLASFIPLRRQADALTADWRSRFLQEYRDIERLDLL
jgi:LPS sulfotransferase NodH